MSMSSRALAKLITADDKLQRQNINFTNRRYVTRMFI